MRSDDFLDFKDIDTETASMGRLYKQVANSLGRESPYRPLNVMAKPSALQGKVPEDIDQITRLTNPNPSDRDAKEMWAIWLSKVVWAEFENASRLETLLWAHREAIKSGDDSSASRLKSYISREYTGPDADLPADALEARAECIRFCRNYKAMPPDWRRVGWGLNDPAYVGSKTPKMPAKKKSVSEWEDW